MSRHLLQMLYYYYESEMSRSARGNVQSKTNIFHGFTVHKQLAGLLIVISRISATLSNYTVLNLLLNTVCRYVLVFPPVRYTYICCLPLTICSQFNISYFSSFFTHMYLILKEKWSKDQQVNREKGKSVSGEWWWRRRSDSLREFTPG